VRLAALAPSSSLWRVKGASDRVAASLGEGWEDQRHGLLVPFTLLFALCLARLFVAAVVWM
jgi:hypothetical protein